jgi:hypothetical protein
MNTFIINILIYCIPTFSAIFVIVAIISKTILKKNGFKVTFLGMTFFSDIRNLKKISKDKTDLRVLYYSLLISTIAFLSLFVMLFFVVISEIISRS